VDRKATKALFESSGKTDFERGNNLGKRIVEGIKNKKIREADISIRMLHEEVTTSAFPIILGQVLFYMFLKAYQEAPGIGDKLTTLYTSKVTDEKMPIAEGKSTIREVKESEPYPHTGMITERYVELSSAKRGEILDITEETIMEDRTGLIMRAAQQYGKWLKADKEVNILSTIQDLTGYKAWYPAGSQAALYSTGTTAPHFCSNQITNALANYTDLDAAYKLMGNMFHTSDKKVPIIVRPKYLLVPVALETTAKRLIKNSVNPGFANNEVNPFANMSEVLSSPHLDVNSTINWFWGDFQEQFLWKEVIPLQIIQRPPNTGDDYERDVKYSYKFRYKGGCGAIDHRQVIKSTGAA